MYTIRLSRYVQIQSYYCKLTGSFHPKVPHLCDLDQDLLEEVCVEAINSKIIGIGLIIPSHEPAECVTRGVVGTKVTKRVIECPSRIISWDRQILERDIGPLSNNRVERFYVGASTSAENKIQIFLPVTVNVEPKAVAICETSHLVLTDHSDVVFIDNDIKERFHGDENNNRYDDAELNAVLQSTLFTNESIRQSNLSMMKMSVSYE